MTLLRNILNITGLYKVYQQVKLFLLSRLTHKFYLHHHWSFRQKKNFLLSFDPVRLATLQLAIQTLQDRKIAGSFAELGVFRGHTSRFVHQYAPERKLFLFDTFTGFPSQDLAPGQQDSRFQDTSLEMLKQTLGDMTNVTVCPGYFPDTALKWQDERFALVVLDADLYNPTLAGLEFFYPRLAAEGYLFIHDYNADESDHAVSKAVNAFFQDKPESWIEIADEGGSIVIRKLKAPGR